MKINKELLKGSSEIMLLAALKEGPLYGYEIAKQIHQQSSAVFSLGEGTMYPILHKLEKQKLLASFWQEVGGRRRKYYQLTSSGKKMLEQRSAEWQAFSQAMNSVI